MGCNIYFKINIGSRVKKGLESRLYSNWSLLWRTKSMKVAPINTLRGVGLGMVSKACCICIYKVEKLILLQIGAVLYYKTDCILYRSRARCSICESFQNYRIFENLLVKDRPNKFFFYRNFLFLDLFIYYVRHI